jgi:type I restriction enzyme M protein
MGADDQQLEPLGALEALGGSAGNGKLRDLLGWDEATYEAVKAPLVASGLLQPGRGRGGSLSLADEAVAGSSAAADRRPAASPRTPRTVSPPTPDPQPSGKQNLSAFIWSVADLLRVAGQAFCNTSALGMKRLMGDQDSIGENLRSYIQAFTPHEVIKLMVNLIFIEDDQALTQGSIVRSLYDPTAGTVCAGKRFGGGDHRPAHRYVL